MRRNQSLILLAKLFLFISVFKKYLMPFVFVCSSKVLEHIRLSLISPYYLHDVIESLDVVKESQGCQKLISQAKDYLLLKDRRAELYSPRARPRRSTGKHTRTYK